MTASKSPARLNIMGVAELLNVRYSAARDLMLKGTFGPTTREGRHLYVPAERVQEYKKARVKS